MDDLNLRQDPVQRPPSDSDRVDPNQQRVEPKKDDRDKFEKTVDKKKTTEDGDEGEGTVVGGDEEGEPSIFGLSTIMNKGKKKDQGPVKDALSGGNGKLFEEEGVFLDEEGKLSSLGDTDEDGKGKNDTFSSEPHKDLFQFIAAATQGVAVVTNEVVTAKTPTTFLSRQDAIDIAQQMLEKVTQIKTQGITSTELTLKFPPLFEGSKITIKEFDSAKGEFNISFENLSAQAKRMVDMEQSQSSLRQNLQDKGYNVHIIIANTEIERPEYKQDANAARDQQQKDQGQQDQQQQKKKDQE